jgi:hypothetical protein
MSALGLNEICDTTNFETCSLLLNARARVQTKAHTQTAENIARWIMGQ